MRENDVVKEVLDVRFETAGQVGQGHHPKDPQ